MTGRNKERKKTRKQSVNYTEEIELKQSRKKIKRERYNQQRTMELEML